MYFSDKKLNGAIIVIGINLAILASIPAEIKKLNNVVLRIQNTKRFIKYLVTDLLWLD
jgi:hypothetical protein